MTIADRSFFCVLQDFGQFGLEGIVNSDDRRETIIENIVTGQYDKIDHVVEYNPAEGWVRDVTDDLASEILDRFERAAEPLSDQLATFIEKHVSDTRALSIRRAA